MKLADHFNVFLKEYVNLSDRRVTQLDERVIAVSSFLKTGDDSIASRFVGVIPQGSYAHRTIINPVDDNDEFDADVLLELTDEPDWSPGEYIDELYKKFRSSGVYRNKVRRRARCVTVDYANEFHMDVVPYVERHGEHFITNRDDDEFELTNPEGFNDWLDEQNRTTGGKLIKVIRLFKYLRDHKNTFSAKSVILTILLGRRVYSAALLADPNCYSDVPTAVKTIFNALNDYLQDNPLMPSLDDPSCPSENFNHRWNQAEYANFRSSVARYTEWINDAYDEPNRVQSIERWRSVFGDDFAASSELEASVQKALAAPACSTEQFLDDLGIREQLDRRYSVRIAGRVLPRSGFRHYNLAAHGNVVGRDRDIRFTIAKCDVPGSYRVYWKVRNYGEEAVKADCIRGQIEEDKGTRSRNEPTAYRGKHYVECYIVQNGVCVAKDRHVVVIK